MVFFLLLISSHGVLAGEKPSEKKTQISSNYILNNIKPLTDGEVHFGYPKWSPDGRKIAMWAGGNIWVMNSDGSNLRNLTPGSYAKSGFKWLPNSNKIVFLHVEYKRERTTVITKFLKLVNINSGNVKTVHTSSNILKPKITEDGGVFVRDAGKKEYKIFDNNGNNIKMTKTEKIYFKDEKRQLKSVEFPDGTEEILYDKKINSFKINSNKDRIFILESGKRSLLNLDDKTLRVFPVLSRSGASINWLQDDKHLITSISSDDGHSILEADIYLFDIENNILTDLTSTPDLIELFPDVSADGKKIVFLDHITGIVFTADIIKK